jgi:hypothetical protein
MTRRDERRETEERVGIRTTEEKVGRERKCITVRVESG